MTLHADESHVSRCTDFSPVFVSSNYIVRNGNEMNLGVHEWYHMHSESVVDYVVDYFWCSCLVEKMCMLCWMGVRICGYWLCNKHIFIICFSTLEFFTLLILNVVSHPLAEYCPSWTSCRYLGVDCCNKWELAHGVNSLVYHCLEVALIL